MHLEKRQGHLMALRPDEQSQFREAGLAPLQYYAPF